MRYSLAIIFFSLALAGCRREAPPSASPPSQAAAPTPAPVSAPETFRGTFGEQFSYSAPVTVRFTPHRAATPVLFLWKDKPIGPMHVIPPPPSSDAKLLKAVIEEDFTRNAELVEYKLFDTASGCTFHRFIGKIEIQGERFFCLLFLVIDPRKPAEMTPPVLTADLAAYRFDFMIPEADIEDVRPHIDSIIDTFKLPDREAIASAEEARAAAIAEVIARSQKDPESDDHTLKAYRNGVRPELIYEMRMRGRSVPKEMQSAEASLKIATRMVGGSFNVGQLRKYGSLGLQFTLRMLEEDGREAVRATVKFEDGLY